MESLNELFYQNPYLKAFTAKVLSCGEGKNGFEVTLSDTAFYPEGGGQPADHGKIGEAIVSDTRKVNGAIIHFTDKPLEVGSEVSCSIDWDRRFSNMQNHSGEHLFSGLVNKKFDYDNVGFHMDDDTITVDFDGPISDEELAELERQTNDAIVSNLPIEISFPDEETRKTLEFRSKKELSGKVRIVDIPGCDRCACCGTHVKTTGEIGAFKVLSSMRHRGGMRIEFVCGLRALADYQRRLTENQKISELLSAKPHEISQAVEKTLNELADRKAEIVALRNEIFEYKAAAIPEGGKVLISFEKDFAPLDLRRFCTLLAEKKKAEHIAVLSETAPGLFSYVLFGPAEEMRDASKALNQKLSGKGGGSGGFVQGSYKADQATIEEAIKAQFA